MCILVHADCMATLLYYNGIKTPNMKNETLFLNVVLYTV